MATGAARGPTPAWCITIAAVLVGCSEGPVAAPPALVAEDPPPHHAPRCIDERLAACEEAVAAFGSLHPATEFSETFLDTFRYHEAALCRSRTYRALIAEHPEVLRRLRRNSVLAEPPMRAHVRGWEDLEPWAGSHERIPWAAAFLESVRACGYAELSSWNDVDRWLRQRFFCAHACCTAERVAEMRSSGIEPGAPRPDLCR